MVRKRDPIGIRVRKYRHNTMDAVKSDWMESTFRLEHNTQKLTPSVRQWPMVVWCSLPVKVKSLSNKLFSIESIQLMNISLIQQSLFFVFPPYDTMGNKSWYSPVFIAKCEEINEMMFLLCRFHVFEHVLL